MHTLWQDLRYASRMLRKSPGVTLLAIASLALGIGANTTIYSVVDTLLLRPLPFPEPDRLVQVWQTRPASGLDQTSLSLPDAADFAALPVFSAAAPLAWQAANLSGEGEPERVDAVAVGRGFFEVLGVAAEVGRVLGPDEAGPGAPRVAVVSHGLWQRRFGGEPGIVGRTVAIDGVATRIVGVMPARFEYPSRGASLWLPLTQSPDPSLRGTRASLMVARLRAGVSLEAAGQALTQMADRLATEYPETNQGRGATLETLRDHFYGPEFTQASLILVVAVLAVLLVACANVANLLLARAVGRGREVAVRSALGASRSRIVRLHLLESLLLALAGGAGGVLLALWGIDGLTLMMQQGIVGVDQIRLDLRVLLFALGLSLLSGLVFGLAPALRGAGVDVAEVLKDGGRGAGGSRRGGRLRGTLVAGEIAVALLLTMCAGLMVRSFLALRQVDPGYDPDGVLTLEVSLPQAGYASDSAVALFASRAEAELGALPGVTGVAAANLLPASSSNSSSGFTIAGLPEPRPGDRPQADHRDVGPGFLSTFRIPLRAGRVLDPSDRAGSPRVVVVNEALVRKYFGGTDPLGAGLKVADGEPFTVVGVVGDYRDRNLKDLPRPTMFFPFGQWPEREFGLALRVQGEPPTLAGPARAALHRIDPTIPVANISTMATRIAERRHGDRIMAMLFLVLAGIGLTLAGAGVFGVMAYSVTQRTGELGVRLAIGASGRDIVWLVLRQGATLAVAGIGAGLPLAMVATRALRSFLAGVSPLDPWTYLVVTCTLAGAVVLASYLPARRAARVDPLIALRSE